MLVEFLCRYQKTLNKEEQTAIDEELSIQSIIKGDAFNADLEKQELLKAQGQEFEYGPMVCNLKDVVGFNYLDQEHTTVRFFGGYSFVYKIPYQYFKGVYQTLTGAIINDFTSVDEFKKMTSIK